jgi:hypothetical protein
LVTLSNFIWHCEIVNADSSGNIQIVDQEGDVGWSSSIALDSNDNPHISYYDKTNNLLKYAYYTGTNWIKQTVDTDVYLRLYSYSSIALDSNDNPHISYYDANGDDLKYAYYTGTNWIKQTVDTDGEVGTYSSIALDSNGNPHISYYDDTYDDLKYAYYSGTIWIKQTVANSGEVGTYSSIALDNNDYPHISFYDESNSCLMYAYNWGSGWWVWTVDNDGDVGEYSSIALDSNDNPHISYYDSTIYSGYNLKYAYNPGSPNWVNETVATEGSSGFFSSIALDSKNNPHISYYAEIDSNQALKYVYKTGSIWIKQTIDTADYAGWYSSIALDSNNHPHISYYDATNNSLKYANLLDTTSPSTVTNLGASNPTPISVTLSWTAPGDDGNTGTATEYDIRYSTTMITDSNWWWAVQCTGEPTPKTAGETETFTITGLTPATTYYFALKTADEIPNWSPISNSPIGTTTLIEIMDLISPAQVTNLATSNPTATSIMLTWTAPGDDGTSGTASVYDIRYSTSAITNTNWDTAITCTGEPSPKAVGEPESFTVTGLNPNTTYYFALRTGDEIPNWSPISNSPSGTTSLIQVMDLISPAQVTNLATSNPTATSIMLTWTAPGDDGTNGTASIYDIRYSTSLITETNWGAATHCIGESSPKLAGESETFTVTGLTPATTYYFAIITGDEVPNWSLVSNSPSGTLQYNTGKVDENKDNNINIWFLVAFVVIILSLLVISIIYKIVVKKNK